MRGLSLVGLVIVIGFGFVCSGFLGFDGLGDFGLLWDDNKVIFVLMEEEMVVNEVDL